MLGPLGPCLDDTHHPLVQHLECSWTTADVPPQELSQTLRWPFETNKPTTEVATSLHCYYCPHPQLHHHLWRGHPEGLYDQPWEKNGLRQGKQTKIGWICIGTWERFLALKSVAQRRREW